MGNGKALTRVLSYGRQSISAEDIEQVVAVLKGDLLTQGPSVEAFEQALAGYLQAKHAVAVSNGTAALHLAALALGLGPGDAVFVPAITFAATSNAVLYTGATPVFVDVDPESLGLKAADLQAAYDLATSRGLKPRAIFPVHYAGLPCDMARILEFARRNDLKVVEDACHAVGAEYRLSEAEPFVPVGSPGFGDMAAWSFHPVKHITTGEGGAVTSTLEELAEQVRRLRTHGIVRTPESFAHRDAAFDPETGSANPWYHEMQTLGYNYRLCDIQAALGKSQVGQAAEFVRRRREIADIYRHQLAGCPNLMLPPGDGLFRKHSYHLFPVRIDFGRLGKSRARVMKELRELGVGTQVHYIPVYRHPYYQNNTNKWLGAPCPNAERFYEEELSIPLFPNLTDADLETVVQALFKVLA